MSRCGTGEGRQVGCGGGLAPRDQHLRTGCGPDPDEEKHACHDQREQGGCP